MRKSVLCHVHTEAFDQHVHHCSLSRTLAGHCMDGFIQDESKHIKRLWCYIRQPLSWLGEDTSTHFSHRAVHVWYLKVKEDHNTHSHIRIRKTVFAENLPLQETCTSGHYGALVVSYNISHQVEFSLILSEKKWMLKIIICNVNLFDSFKCKGYCCGGDSSVKNDLASIVSWGLLLVYL